MNTLLSMLSEHGFIHSNLSEQVRLTILDGLIAENAGFNDAANGLEKKQYRFFREHTEKHTAGKQSADKVAAFLYESYLYGYNHGVDL